MLILILNDVQYLLKVVFSFGEGSNIQNHSTSGSQHPTTKLPSTKFFIFPPTRRDFTPLLNAIWKTLVSRYLSVKPCLCGWFRDPEVRLRPFSFSKNTEKGTSNAFLKAANLCLRKNII